MRNMQLITKFERTQIGFLWILFSLVMLCNFIDGFLLRGYKDEILKTQQETNNKIDEINQRLVQVIESNGLNGEGL